MSTRDEWPNNEAGWLEGLDYRTQHERVQIFTVDGSQNALGQFRWGWQCFACGDEETRWRNATTARDAADQHGALCDARSRLPADTDTGRGQ